ncbi:MAG: TIGR04283 family arsenosugar biosynthesis glycosyltransferase [Chromatiales bacterium]|nr:TIGR04283 family arsenosugar biosynthesis glycosyltransferase [Chromatiales bacterium]
MTSISVVVPARDESANIEAVLKDLAPLEAERIVVDGGSMDDTMARARPHCEVLLSCKAGRATQMNMGASVAKGELLWFVHADTRVSARALTALADIAQRGTWGRFDVRLSGDRWAFRVIEWFMNRRSCWTGVATGDQGIFVCREWFEAVGGFPDIPLMEDVALSKCLRRKARPWCLHQPLLASSRRWEQAGILRTVVLMWRLRLGYFLGVAPENLAKSYR